MLLISEIYKSIQGETSFSGLPFIFIRLAECDLNCSYCDTQYAKKGGEKLTIREVLKTVKKLGAKNVCVTGGEPLLQKECLKLLDILISQGYIVLLETNGVEGISEVNKKVRIIMDIKTPGSKVLRETNWNNVKYLKKKDEVKFVVTSYNDFKWAIKIIKKYNLHKKTNILFSPAFEMVKLKDLAKWVLDCKLDVRMQWQFHKFIWGTNIRGI